MGSKSLKILAKHVDQEIQLNLVFLNTERNSQIYWHLSKTFIIKNNLISWTECRHSEVKSFCNENARSMFWTKTHEASR